MMKMERGLSLLSLFGFCFLIQVQVQVQCQFGFWVDLNSTISPFSAGNYDYSNEFFQIMPRPYIAVYPFTTSISEKDVVYPALGGGEGVYTLGYGKANESFYIQFSKNGFGTFDNTVADSVSISVLYSFCTFSLPATYPLNMQCDQQQTIAPRTLR
eukprot:TRINITY_DN8725_c0_g1_i2.p1 TRINITY_DN8725_c0_g1~~TRINITY_DN8725_c0_g1_i2.p1  ORF type:complete len:156 (-),score=42.84 TRINITY_DN8725_c0_g1_i2:62-529(-)